MHSSESDQLFSARVTDIVFGGSVALGSQGCHVTCNVKSRPGNLNCRTVLRVPHRKQGDAIQSPGRFGTRSADRQTLPHRIHRPQAKALHER